MLRTKVNQLNFSTKANYFLLNNKLCNLHVHAFVLINKIENISSIFC